MTRHYLVADIGGTHIRVARFSNDSQIPITLERIPTQAPGESPLERLTSLLAASLPGNEPVSAIAVAAPGPTDPYEGVVCEAPNIPGWTNLPLKKHLQQHFYVPIAVGNDANMAALGEWKFGAGRGHHHLVYITISTGIGGGVIINDQLLLGAGGLAGELGHVTVLPDGPLCGCGQRGHLEALAAGPAIARWVEDEINQGVPSSLSGKKQISSKDVAQAASNGDTLSQAALARAGTFLGIAVANYLQIFNPSIVILGGGVSRSGPILIDSLKTALHEHVMSPKYLHGLTVTTAALGDNVGLLGALALAQTLA